MPIYEYACSACGHETEVWQKIGEKPKRTCPSCGTKHLERLISHTSFQLKGTGWYVTDYARKDGGGGASAKPSKAKPAATEKSDSASTSKAD